MKQHNSPKWKILENKDGEWGNWFEMGTSQFPSMMTVILDNLLLIADHC